MSVRASNWAWEQELVPAPKLILLALADHSNDRDECWPGVPYLARKCCVSERTVQRVLQDLRISNLIAIDERYDARNGRRIQNLYRLNLSGKSNPDKGGSSDNGKGETSSQNDGVEAGPDKLSPPNSEVNNGPNLSGAMVTRPVIDDGDTVMSPLKSPHESKQQPLHIPRSLSSIERQAISSLCEQIPHEDAQSLLDELADAMETGSIRTNALRWFRGLIGRYRKGEFISVGGVRIAARRARTLEAERQGALIPEPTDRTVARKSIAQIKEIVAGPRATAKESRDTSSDKVEESSKVEGVDE